MFSWTRNQLSQEDITQVYRSCFPVLLAKCQRMLPCRADAEDVAQEVFLRLLKSDLLSRQVGPTQQALLAWIYRVSTRAAIDRLRGQRVRARHRAELHSEQARHSEPAQLGVGAEALLSARQTVERLVRAVPPAELEAVILHRLDLLSQPEIAAITGSSERTVRRLLSRFDARVAAMTPRLIEETVP